LERALKTCFLEDLTWLYKSPIWRASSALVKGSFGWSAASELVGSSGIKPCRAQGWRYSLGRPNRHVLADKIKKQSTQQTKQQKKPFFSFIGIYYTKEILSSLQVNGS
jgi:hypothetical protein